MFRNAYFYTPTGYVASVTWRWPGAWRAALVSSQGRTLASQDFVASPEARGSVDAAFQAACAWVKRQAVN